MVGETGFEPATPCTQNKCATKLRHSPNLRIGVNFITATGCAYYRLAPTSSNTFLA